MLAGIRRGIFYAVLFCSPVFRSAARTIAFVISKLCASRTIAQNRAEARTLSSTLIEACASRHGSAISNRGAHPMCDYSLHAVATRPAQVGETLITTTFRGTSTRGFASERDPNVAVCMLPGPSWRLEMTSSMTTAGSGRRPPAIASASSIRSIRMFATVIMTRSSPRRQLRAGDAALRRSAGNGAAAAGDTAALRACARRSKRPQRARHRCSRADGSHGRPSVPPADREHDRSEPERPRSNPGRR